MTERSYPAEPPVNLRTVRKAGPRPTTDDTDDGHTTAASGGRVQRHLLADSPDSFVPSDAELAAPRPALPELSGLMPEHDGSDADPARWGFRGWANAATGGVLKLKPKTPEIEARAALTAVRQQWLGQQTIMVANPKGGEGKTIAALMLGSIFGEARGGNVVVWDTNEADGTLGIRAAVAKPAATVADMLEHASELADPTTPVSAMTQFLRMQPTRNEILAAAAPTPGAAQLTADDCRDIHRVLTRFRELVILDTGNNRCRSSWLWAAYNAHLLVIPMTMREDSALVVCQMLATLHDLELYSLITNAILVLTAPPTGVAADKRALILQALRDHGIRNAVEVPYDPVLAGGGRINHAKLSENTVTAWTRVAAMAATSLAESSRLRAPRFRGQSTTTEDVDDDVPLLAQQRGRTAHQSLLGGQHDPTNSATDRLHRFGA
ncbi:hypothetical protein IU444_28840 [Nocardia farcinica]|uniref:MinD/ParA family ATP-binding protein n=1 Tax=Nocardia farcinica TaxID=37329 RepID=UPI0018947F21|nr:hypothetical protein [Nocardia farcinica]MBF6388138.1 hypothetical protein [Nocardia farcinica]UEX26364.1 hypothetical protein LMJ57_30920 [Nocardia farcinica]